MTVETLPTVVRNIYRAWYARKIDDWQLAFAISAIEAWIRHEAEKVQ